MAKLKVSDSKMRERGYFISKANGSTLYVLGEFLLMVGAGDREGKIFTNNDEQLHDIDLDELEYLEQIYK